MSLADRAQQREHLADGLETLKQTAPNKGAQDAAAQGGLHLVHGIRIHAGGGVEDHTRPAGLITALSVGINIAPPGPPNASCSEHSCASSGQDPLGLALGPARGLGPFLQPAAQGVKEALEVMIELGDQAITMLCVAHKMVFAKAVAARVVFMGQGQIVEGNTPDEFFNTFRYRPLSGTLH